MFQLLARVESVKKRHIQVHKDHIGLKLWRLAQKRAAVAHCTYDLKFGFEQSLECLGNERVIVSEQDPCFGHSGLRARSGGRDLVADLEYRRNGRRGSHRQGFTFFTKVNAWKYCLAVGT